MRAIDRGFKVHGPFSFGADAVVAAIKLRMSRSALCRARCTGWRPLPAVYPWPHRITYTWRSPTLQERSSTSGHAVRRPSSYARRALVLSNVAADRPSDLVFGNIARFDDRLGASRTLPNMRPTLGTGREPTITSRLQPHQTDEIEKRRAATKQPPASSLIQPTPM